MQHSLASQILKPGKKIPLFFAMILTLLIPTLLSAQPEPPTPPKEPLPEPISKPEKSPTKKILFIGNSFTFWRGGLDQHLKILSESMSPPLGYETKAVTRGGASLEVMWKKSAAIEQINKGKYDVVILQEDLPETTVDSFRTYSKKFIDLVRKSGARPILFMAWDYERLNWISMEEIANAHLDVSRKLKVEVAPVGYSWALSKKRQPSLNMYVRDAEHPSVAGMYLSLLIIESTISGKSPLTRSVENLDIPGLDQLNSKGRRYLQEVARDALKAWKQK